MEEHTTIKQRFLNAYDEYADAIFRYCLFQTSNRDVALDLTQETFIRTWQYLADGHTIDDIRPFLYRVAKNAIIDFRRKKGSQSLDTMLEAGFDIPARENIEQEQEAVFEVERTLELLEELDEKYRTVIILRFVEQLSIAEIAKITKRSKNTISVQIHRGLEKLRNLHE